MANDLSAVGQAALLHALREGNELGQRYGVSLSEGQMQALADARETALRDMGRVEFGPGVLPRLMYALCDSPYANRADWFDTLLAMQEAFYYYKSECGDAFADDELAEALALAFNGPAQGDVDFVQGLSPEELYRLWREGRMPDDE